MLPTKMSPIVRAYILSETMLWSAWNFFAPIAAIFVTTKIHGGSIEIAATSYSVYLATRVLFELISGRFLAKSGDRLKIIITVSGISIMSACYVGFAFSNDVLQLMILYALLGVGLGSASPAKNSLFSIHLDKSKEATEWGTAEALTFTGMALSGVIGGYIATRFGFEILFMVAAIINFSSIIPYLPRLKSHPVTAS